MITDVDGIAVGHWTDREAVTGCTVILLPEDTVASGEVRGGAPATREFALLDPTRLVGRVDAVVLTGGSALGLGAADGVARWLHERGRGYPTGVGPVPIVVGLGLFDLARGAVAWPDAAAGYSAAEAAGPGPHAVGLVGAGIGCTTDKWRGLEHATPAGLAARTERDGELVVSVLVAVNAHGQIDRGDDPPWPAAALGDHAFLADPGEAALTNTTVGVVATNARLDKLGCHWVAQGAHDGLARALVPSHARSDGDAFVAVAVGAATGVVAVGAAAGAVAVDAATGVVAAGTAAGAVDASVDHVRFLATRAVQRAVLSLA